ncbi:MAG: alpha/beta-hydrolase family protein [Pseudomonadota bacterium]
MEEIGTEPARRSFLSRLAPSIPGTIAATAFFCASLTPSLIPRDPVMQGLLSGAISAIGYEIANILAILWRYLEIPAPRMGWRVFRRAVYLGCALAVLWALWNAADWQNITREVAGLEPVDTSHPLTVAGYAFGVFVLLYIVFRVLGSVFDAIARGLARVLPKRVSAIIAVVAVAWIAWAVADGVLVQRALEAADKSFETADLLIEPEVPQPTDPAKTGSPASLIVWEEMGRHGRAFVATAPTQAEIATFHEDAMEPIRVYVGRRSADTAEDRAELALQELIRAGGFERSNLVVMVPVGTGWMDPGGQDTLDFILGGDVATVAAQYSYLTSVLSLITNPEYGVEQARALFQKIYGYWQTLPKDSRPRFFVHGLSQGAFNSQMTLPLFDLLVDPIDGGLWAGSPFISPTWQRVRDGRAEGSPVWRPVFGNSSLARVRNQEGGADIGDPPWGPMRFVFLHYGSDAIVNFTFGSAFRRPGWFNEPRPPDVSPELSWLPLVTMFQLGLDMAVSLQVERFGHYYVAPDYIDAWAAVLDPEDWSPERAEELKAIFVARGPSF